MDDDVKEAPSSANASKSLEGTAAGSGEEDPTGQVDSAARKTTVRMRLIAQYKLNSAFIGVSQLATILGRSTSAIYADIRAGRFMLPYRYFNKTPMVCIDDLVEWYCSASRVVPAFGARPEFPAPTEGEDGGGRALSWDEVNAAIDKAADDASRAVGVDPSSRRRRGRPRRL